VWCIDCVRLVRRSKPEVIADDGISKIVIFRACIGRDAGDLMHGNDRAILRLRSRCPCCEGVEFRVLASEPYGAAPLRTYLEQYYQGRACVDELSGFDYELVRCAQCTLAYQRAVPTTEMLTEIYETWILPSEKDRLRRERDINDYCYMAEQVQFIARHFRSRPSDIRILDFGMGWAEWADMARAFGCEVAGSELSLHRIKHARSIGIEVVDWDEIPKRKFDFINTEQVFEHLIEPLEVLRHLSRALNRGGLIRISVPDSRVALNNLSGHGSFSKLTASQIMPMAPLEHVNSFEYRSLVAFAKSVGLRVVRPSIVDLYNSSSGWFSIKNALRLCLRPLYRHIYPKSTVVYFGRQ
jgi:hypothetical protein